MPTVVMYVHVLPGEQGCQVIRGELRVSGSAAPVHWNSCAAGTAPQPLAGEPASDGDRRPAGQVVQLSQHDRREADLVRVRLSESGEVRGALPGRGATAQSGDGIPPQAARPGREAPKVAKPCRRWPLKAPFRRRVGVQRAGEGVDVVMMMTVLGVQQPGDVQNPRVKADRRAKQRAEPFPHRRTNEFRVVISRHEVDAYTGGERIRQGGHHYGVGCGYPVKLGDRFGLAAGEQAGTRASDRNPQEIEGVAEEHQPAPRARAETAKKLNEGLVISELVAESRAPDTRRAAAEMEVAGDDERGFAHRSVSSSRFSRKWAATAPPR